ncbi:NUDIX domain-containing protein [bacterium]|nr:NUDIX domain-containing protein [bacterium]
MASAKPVSAQGPKKKVQVWIHWNQQWVLILKTIPERGSMWQPVTGHVEPGESSEQGAVREATEETQLIFEKPIDLEIEHHFKGRFGPVVERVYSLETKGKIAPIVEIDPKEHVEWKWVKPEDALQVLRYKSQKDSLAKMIREVWKKNFP